MNQEEPIDLIQHSNASALLDRAAKDRLLLENRKRLDQDLLQRRLVFESMPRVVDLQLSNICNMSCTMCYDGANPPPKKLDLQVLERFAQEALPTALSITPFSGSEPLIVTWELTKKLAERFDLELDIITNVQFLDAKKFAELEPHVSSLTFSIDSHMRDIYERIRLRSNPDKVFENLPRAVRLCREHGIEPFANVVLMTENAAWIEETVAFLADQGCSTVRLLAFHTPFGSSQDRSYSDAIVHMSPEWVRWKLEQVWQVAKDKRIQVLFEGLHRQSRDFREAPERFRPDRRGLHGVGQELPFYHPGYCALSVDRVKVSTDAEVHPCCVAEGEDLKLGDLREQGFHDIWNGSNAQDLRRAMLTLDLPELCKHCCHHTANLPSEQRSLPFVDWWHDSHCGGAVPRFEESQLRLDAILPEHLARQSDPPTFRWSRTGTKNDVVHFVVAIAGAWGTANRVFELDGDADHFTMPDADWRALPPNTGLWWFVAALNRTALGEAERTARIRCVVRDEAIPRIQGSTLYARDHLHRKKA